MESRLNLQDKRVIQRNFKLGSLKTFVLFIKSYVAPAFESDRSPLMQVSDRLNSNKNKQLLDSSEFLEWAKSLEDHSRVELNNLDEIIESIDTTNYFDEE